MDDNEATAGKDQPSKRPRAYSDLLARPIADDPGEASASYEDWEFDHGDAVRFYVGGIRRFMREVKTYEVQAMAAFAGEAAKVIEGQTDWRDMPLSSGKWDRVSLNQFSAAKKREPMMFAKAASVILACERMMASQKDKVPDPAHIYRYMKIVPACWTIGDFDEAFLKAARSSLGNFEPELLDATGQASGAVFEDMAKGHPVTFETANAVAKFFKDRWPDRPLGALRARVRNKPGRLSASRAEVVDLD